MNERKLEIMHTPCPAVMLMGAMEEYIFGPIIDPSSTATEISPPYPPTSRTEVNPARRVFSRSLDILAPARAALERRLAYPARSASIPTPK